MIFETVFTMDTTSLKIGAGATREIGANRASTRQTVLCG
jgi:hypothetical protein